MASVTTCNINTKKHIATTKIKTSKSFCRFFKLKCKIIVHAADRMMTQSIVICAANIAMLGLKIKFTLRRKSFN